MARELRLTIHDFNDWPAEFTGSLSSPWAYTVGDEIHIRSPAHLRAFGGLGRVWHEVEHATDPSFTNDQHHSWWHLCLRSKVPFRLHYHATADASLAHRLLDWRRVSVA